MDCSTPGLPVHHQLPEFTQTHVHRVGNAIQPSHPLSSPSPPAFNLSQHQGLFQWVSSLHQVVKVLRVSASASVLPMCIQDWFPLGWTSWISRRRQWQATPVLLPRKSNGWRSLVGCIPWGHYESVATEQLTFTFTKWRRKWQPTPVFLPGESQGRQSLVGCRLWGRTELDTTEAT